VAREAARHPKLHTHLGILDCKSLVGKPYGILAVTTRTTRSTS